MSHIRVGVLRGGPSSEYDISLKTGENVLQNLPRDTYKPIDIFVSKDGEWHHRGTTAPPEKILRHVDVVFNAMHGEYGEDGTVQKILEAHIPYTGSRVLASHLAMKKTVARTIFSQHGLTVLPAVTIKRGADLTQKAYEIIRTIAPAWAVKPAGKGSSVGVTIAQNVYELIDAMEHAFKHDHTILVEKYIRGKEVTCGILEHFRGMDYYPLPVVEIIPPHKKPFFDFESKYDGSTQEICPARLDSATAARIQSTAKIAHTALGCRHYSRTDMILANNTVYVLETNTLPGLTSESLLPKSADAIGCSFPQLLSHLVRTALNKE